MKEHHGKVLFLVTESGIIFLSIFVSFFKYGYVMSSILAFFAIYLGTKFLKVLFWYNFQERYMERVVYYIKKFGSKWEDEVTVDDFVKIPAYKNFQKSIKPFSILVGATFFASMIAFPFFSYYLMGDEWILSSLVNSMISLSGISVTMVAYPIACAYMTTRLINRVLKDYGKNGRL